MATNLILQSLEFLKNKIDNASDLDSVIEIQNIATLNDGDEFLNSTSPIILSLINVEEDKISKNPNKYLPNTNNSQEIQKYSNPPQHLVLSLLFTSYNKEQSTDKYTDGLEKLEHVISCFQKQNVYYYTSPTEEVFKIIDPDSGEIKIVLDPNSNPLVEVTDYSKLILDMESLKIPELNQLWSIAGNKYMPSVLYKMRMITIESEPLEETERAIDKAKIQLWNNNPENLAGQLEITKDIILDNT